MITEKVLGAYAAVGTLPPEEQSRWYRKIADDWGINCFEIPFVAGVPVAGELVQAFAEMSASLVVTLVAQGAIVGQQNPAYGLSSLDGLSRRTAVMDAFAILHQCVSLAGKGIRIRNVMIQTGQRMGEPIPHAIAFYQSLIDIRALMGSVLPDTILSVEPADNLPQAHPTPFPAAKKSSLSISDLIQTVESVNRNSAGGHPLSFVVNWGRVLINGDDPISKIKEILGSDVPLAGVIMSGAGSSPNGYCDSHNSHLDPDSGFTLEDARACAGVLRDSSQPIFIGSKCSRKKGGGEVSVEEILSAQAGLLNENS
ncbi:MAG: DUF4862 family protein [Planctomycetota bacterium]|nr:DUF4862 family protein [Planctomycetota bacterium]